MAIFLLAMVAGSCAGLAQPRGLTAHMSRRAALALAPSLFVAVPMIAGAADDETALVAELKDCVAKLKPLSAMLDKEQWDPVRTVLKNPPVANLYVYHSCGPTRLPPSRRAQCSAPSRRAQCSAR